MVGIISNPVYSMAETFYMENRPFDHSPEISAVKRQPSLFAVSITFLKLIFFLRLF